MEAIAPFAIAGRRIGPDEPVYVIAEVSANHLGSLERARKLVGEAAQAGADAVKLQTFTADTITIKSRRPEFKIGGGTKWDGRWLHDLYEEAHTPWEWHGELRDAAREAGIELFSSPFDPSAVDFLLKLGVSAMKIASAELVDLPLIDYVARTGKPVIASTGMATRAEVDEAVEVLSAAATGGFCLLKCTSGYPAPAAELNLRTIPDMMERYGVPVGFSDHTVDANASIAAVALGACVIEKHLTLRRKDGGPDASFSAEPAELRRLVTAVRRAQKHAGSVRYGATQSEEANLRFRRSLYVVKPVKEGEPFTKNNLRSIRPSAGLPPKFLVKVLGRRATQQIDAGTPLSEKHVEW